jgi:RNA polymerase sigma-70 factor, ECF subfamily
MDTRSDPDLLLAMSRGDESAAQTLHSRIGPRVLSYARAFLRDDALAEDVAQQAWLRALTRSPSELRSVRDAMGWMIRVTRSIALNQLRSRSRAQLRDRSLPASESRVSQGLAPDHADLLSALQRLPEDGRDVILLRHIAGLTFDQIAATLDEHRSTVATRYRAAITELRASAGAPATQAPAQVSIESPAFPSSTSPHHA